VGSATVHALSPSCCEANAVHRKIRVAAQCRKEELLRRKRFGAEHGALGGLCALVRFLFGIDQEARDAEPRKNLLRKFALAVLQAADIPCDDYRVHPSRMDKLFSTEIRDEKFAVLLRQEIETYLAPPSEV
jgi:hypothetical protein